jgi:hypothetical protein
MVVHNGCHTSLPRVFRNRMKQMVLTRLILRLPAALAQGDEDCCPIVLKIFHKRIYIKNKDIYSHKSNAAIPYCPVPRASRVPFRFGKEAKETTILGHLDGVLGPADRRSGLTTALSSPGVGGEAFSDKACTARIG